MTTIVPYGSWISPLSAADASAAAARFDGARYVGDEIWWGESLPDEGGRTTVRRAADDGTAIDVLPAPWSARSRVHEYGGGSWTTSDDGRLFFVEKTDQRVWMLRPGGEPVALTPVDDRARHGGLRWQAGTLLAVREVHDDSPVPRRSIVAIPLSGGEVRELVTGSDFLAQPALSPDGRRLAWVAWDHPDMPWDRTQIRVAELDDGPVSTWRTVTSGATAALQPEWDAAGRLVFIDDPTGRWNLRREDAASAEGSVPVAPADADTGGGRWVLGVRWYAPLADGGFVAVRTNGADEVARFFAEGDLSQLAGPVERPEGGRVDTIVVGRDLANEVGLKVGDTAAITAPGAETRDGQLTATTKDFRVVGIFESGLYDYDSRWAYVSLDAAKRLLDDEEVVQVEPDIGLILQPDTEIPERSG